MVKTSQFRNFNYVGDPVNTCRIFNELEVDELVFLDIAASPTGSGPDFKLLSDISSECFMPLSYGGGVSSVDEASKILGLGFEKIVVNTSALKTPRLINEMSKSFGSQSVIVAIDVGRGYWGKQYCLGKSGRWNTKKDPVEWAKMIQEYGAGEILLTSIEREGTWSGFDIELIRSVTDAVSIPVIAHGGAGEIKDIKQAIQQGGASAVALGSMVVYQKKGMGVLVNFLDSELKNASFLNTS